MENSMRTPLHLWIVGSVSALWNAFGCFDYVMSQTRNQAYLAALTDAQRAYFDHFPAWVQAAWAFGVWGALLGSMLLLTRSRWAVTAFAVSLAGLAVSTAWQYGVSAAPAEMRSAPMMIMNLVIWAVAIGLLLYALRMRQRGALR